MVAIYKTQPNQKDKFYQNISFIVYKLQYISSKRNIEIEFISY